ncbi:FecCD family ABC transporter permease [Cytobacillus firmus]|uniref:FecCD family ABC transporter permease n=1 Tax=Cytobacillus firmus TaxID=1399 RepID=UPI0015807BA9|nr:iron ABC transporter permease [Cytobacillus firmus]MBG9546268.1 iron ABC transporter permease [Cytobacillus firmus]MBG9600750.1 iron ABC transporter permease [Cytobacillus firmus]MBG9654676.1 iron ABC transporter permease [Cytobacillus firmus]MDD9314052.1 iron ABC transporter permease [Cytobacillus firmus]MED1905502.1 iron ABC transporter permease [Cytobacillus firmus]
MDWKQALLQSWGWMAAFIFLILVTFVLSLATGVMPVGMNEIMAVLSGSGTPNQELVLLQLRLPRMIISLLIGAGLALSGSILQGLSRNSLADPGILGINAGAGLAVVLSIYLFGQSGGSLLAKPFFLPVFAFAGALAIAALIYRFSWKGGIDPERLLLVGLGFNALCGALLLILQLKMDPKDFQQAAIWLTGSIWGIQWPYVWALLPWILVLMPVAFKKARTMNILQFKQEVPIALGLRVESERRLLLCLSAALAGACVAAGGGIAFIGLLAPHLARRLCGPNYFSNLPLSALIGAALVLIADMIGKNLLAPADIPVGIVISVIGAPYLIFMLLTRKGTGLKA